ncbi:MAG TPA: 2-dehydropantoate 2-reductase [Kofleriaceae bacterium]|nr:2-dehydropantoate 2-reductase [Kofleriaceae bacterium]
MRVAVLGTGGVGGYFGGRLAEAGHDVWFVARGAHLDAMRAGGLRVDSVAGDFALPQVQATADTSEIGPVDLVMVCVKAWQVVEVAGSIRPLIGADTAVLPLQNGVESSDQLIERLGPDHVLGGVARIISFLSGPGHVTHAAHAPHIFAGELDRSRSERALRVVGAMQVRGVSCELAGDIRAEQWIKFVFGAAWGAVAALSGAPCGPLRELPATRQLLLDAMREVTAVAAARGIALPGDPVAHSMAVLDSLPPEATVSLQRDLAAGVPSEIDAWSGAVVRLGSAAGVPTPIHRVASESMLPRELRARGQLEF